MTRPRLPGWIAALIVAVGLFSLGFSLLAERGLWPQLPPGALHGTDLVAGFAVVLGLIVLLWREAPRRLGSDSHGPLGSSTRLKAEDPKLKTENWP